MEIETADNELRRPSIQASRSGLLRKGGHFSKEGPSGCVSLPSPDGKQRPFAVAEVLQLPAGTWMDSRSPDGESAGLREGRREPAWQNPSAHKSHSRVRA